MTYNEKISVLMETINRAVALDEPVQHVIKTALIDGYMRIVQAEGLEKKADAILHPEYCPDCGAALYPGAVCDCRRTHFPVNPILEGYGYWSCGGFDAERQRGLFTLAVSPDGEPLKEAGRVREPNGRHVLSVVYPECYILQAACRFPPVITLNIYKVLSISRISEKASCERIYEDRMPEVLYERMLPAMELARNECMRPYNRNNHYNWRCTG